MLVESLISANPAAVLTPDPGDKCLPIHLCCEAAYPSPGKGGHTSDKCNNLETLNLLLAEGGDRQCQMKDVDGDLPIHRAVYKRAGLPVVERLCVANIDGLRSKNNDGACCLPSIYSLVVATHTRATHTQHTHTTHVWISRPARQVTGL